MQNMADVLHRTFVRVTMVGPDKDVLNVYPYPVASMEVAKKRHFNAYAMTQTDGLEHFVINVINFCSLRSESHLKINIHNMNPIKYFMIHYECSIYSRL